MTLKTKLHLLVIAVGLAVLGLTLFHEWSSRQVNLRLSYAVALQKIANDLFELEFLANDYLRVPGGRPQVQWEQMYNHVSTELGDLESSSNDVREHQALEGLRRDMATVSSLFSQVVEASDHGPLLDHLHTDEHLVDGENPVDQMVIRGLTSRFTRTTRSMASTASKLSELRAADAQQEAQQAVAVKLVIGVLLAISLGAIAYLIGKSVSKKVDKLRHGAEVFAGGNLSHVVDVAGKDELSTLAKSFNEMAAQLDTSRRLLEQKNAELEQARDVALEATRSKSLFISSVSHELRTPMNAIIGCADSLSRTQLTRRQQEYLQITQRAGETLLDLTNNILDLAKVDSEQLQLEQTEFDLADLLHATTQLLAVRAEEKNLELICRIKPDVPFALIGDPSRLRQVITNLLSNAIKFTEKGQVVVQVEIDPTPAEPGSLLFQVSDSGIGIPHHKLESVFDPFSQVDSSTTRQYGGTGLGLTICRQLVPLMGGRIWVESQLGIGSTFHFTAQFETQHKEVDEGNVIGSPLRDLSGLKALVVDDNALFCAFLEELLAEWGARHMSVGGGSEALEELSRAAGEGEPYGLVLLDRDMPDMDGLEVISHIPREPAIKDIPVIIVTGTLDLRDNLTLEPGLDICGWLTKPLSQSDLLQAIAEARGLSLGGVHERTPPEDPLPDEILPELRILLVDDYDDNCFVVQAHLEETPYQIDIAENGEIAIDMFKSVNYDLVLMDVQMPVMDGYTATRIIRSWEQEQGLDPTPIVALTANALADDLYKSIEAGCTSHLSKPIRRGPLMAEIAGRTNGETG